VISDADHPIHSFVYALLPAKGVRAIAIRASREEHMPALELADVAIVD
jgi:hypothetical protein